MATARNIIKKWFSNFKKPTQEQFWAWIDSFVHKDDKIPMQQVEGLETALQSVPTSDQFSNHINDGNAHQALFAQLRVELQQIVDTYLQSGGYTGTAQELKEMIDNVMIILESPDTQLDSLREIVAYIKQNKEILSTLAISNIAGLVDALEEKADKVHNHNETYYTKDEVLELTNKTPLMTSLTYFKTTKVFTDVGGGVQYGNTTLLMNPGQNHTIEIVKEGARKIFRYVKLDDGEVNFTSSSDDGIFVIEYTTSDTILKKGGEAIVVLNGANAWISINNEKSNQGIGNLQIGGENLISGGRHFVRTATNGEVFSPILYGGLQQGKTYILNAEKIKGADTRMFTISRSQHYNSTTHQDIEIGVPFVANHEHTYLWVYPDNNGEIEYKNVILQEGNVGTSFVPERGADSGLSEEEKQQLIKKGTTKNILLEDGTTISKEGLLEGQTNVPDDQFEFKFEDKWLWWKLKTEKTTAWKKLLYNYELRPLDNQTLIAKVDRNRIYIKKQGESDEKYKELLMGQWISAFKYKVLDNKKIQWHSGLLRAEWVDMPFFSNEETRKNTEGNMMVRVNTLRFVEDGQEKLISVENPNLFNIKILDGNYLQWKETTEDDTKWKRLPFHGENFHLKYALQARVQNGIIQYKFEFEDDTEYKDLVRTQDLFPIEGVKVISTKNIIGDTRTWLNVLFACHRNILIKAGRYDLKAVTNIGVRIHSNSNIVSEEGVEFKVLSNPLPHFTVFRIEDANNVTIRGGLLVGDKADHQWMNPKEDNYFYRSEQIHGVYIAKSENVTIENLTAKDFIGDGMLLSRANNIYVRNTKLHNARMEGLGIRSADNVVFDTCEFSFTSPAEASNFRNLGYGTDIEPIYNRNHFRNIKFLNCVFEDNGGFEPAGFSLSTAQHGSMKYEFKSENEFIPTHVSVELINPVFKGCGLFARIPTNWTHGYLRIFNATVINSKRFGVAFMDHNSDNFHTYIDGLKLIDCGTELHWTGGETQYYSRPLCFYSSANGTSQHIEQRNTNQRKGNKNIHIKNVEIINSGKVTYKKAAMTVYANPDKANDLENVQIENVKVVGYQKVFENLSKHQIHSSFQLTQHPETQLLNSDVVSKDIEIGNDSVHTFLNKTTIGNITFKDEIYPSNLEYYAKNSSTGEVKLKFESSTDIEGLAYGVQEFALARGKRLKMRKIDTNRWEYLEGTA